MLLNLTDPDSVSRAIEENAANLLLAMGRAGGGEEYQDDVIHWTIGGSPVDYHNAVVHADLTQTASPNEVIQNIVEKLQAHNVPGSWHVGPSMQPANLGELLVQHAFEYGGSEPGMAVDLQALNENISYPPELQFERVNDADKLKIWVQTLAQGFGEGEREANWVGEVYAKIGLTPDSGFHHLLAWLDGETLATTTLFLNGETAGIYFVMTVPQARRKGIGAAITLAALKEARTLGYHVGVLGASEAGYPVYERLGFKTFCQIGIYEYKIDSK